jgi:hypothetical protein
MNLLLLSIKKKELKIERKKLKIRRTESSLPVMSS